MVPQCQRSPIVGVEVELQVALEAFEAGGVVPDVGGGLDALLR